MSFDGTKKPKYRLIQSETGRITSVDCNFSQAETRWLERLKKGDLPGPETSGKTTLLADFLVRVLEQGGCVAMLDSEQSLDPEILERMGVVTKKKGDIP